jgi:hypothetical protein
MFSFSSSSKKKAEPSAPVSISEPRPAQSNEAAKERLNSDPRHKTSKVGAFSGMQRGAAEIEKSGVLAEFRELQGVRVSESEFDRTLDDDAVLVQQGLGKMSADQIAEMKKAAYEHPEAKADLDAAIKKKHYGSERHRKYGETIEFLTGGVISAEEAMAMNPTGGIPGAGAKEVPLSTLGPVARHAMRHDATGFLTTRFGVGPGYGSKTSWIGRASNDPLAGQILGMAREILSPTEDIPSGETAAKPGRFNEPAPG